MADVVTWVAEELTRPTWDAEGDCWVPPGVFLLCRGDDHDDVRAVLRLEHAVAPDGAEASRDLAQALADRLNATGLTPGVTE